MILNFAFGVAHGDRLLGTVTNKTRFGFTSLKSPVVVINQMVINTNILKLPINCVLAGDQIEQEARKFPVDMFGILKRIFRE